MSKNAKISKNRHPGECRGPEDVDFIDPTALDPGIRRGDGVFFDTLLIQITMIIFGFYVGAASATITLGAHLTRIAAKAAPTGFCCYG